MLDGFTNIKDSGFQALWLIFSTENWTIKIIKEVCVSVWIHVQEGNIVHFYSKAKILNLSL